MRKLSTGPSSFGRRSFLKLALAVAGASLLGGRQPALERSPGQAISNQHSAITNPNIIILLFDTLSAAHLSLYGYPRQTTPNIDRFAGQATVYHNHRVAGNFTTPSTASLFTSTFPFTHRAFNLSGLVAPWVRPQNLFTLLSQAGYRNTVFTHNIYADMLLYLFEQDIHKHVPLDSFTLAGRTFYNHLFPNDAINGMKSYDQFLFKREEAHGALFLSLLNDLETMHAADLAEQQYARLHPKRLPRLSNTDLSFVLSQVMEGVVQVLSRALPRGLDGAALGDQGRGVQGPGNPNPTAGGEPFFAYIHLMPPHAPYEPTTHFSGRFADGWAPAKKKRHRLSTRLDEARLNALRQQYDEFLLNMDAELGRVLSYLESSGRMQDSYIFLTSDHGELFERGTHGHSTPLMYDDLVRVPLIVHAPGQTERRDVTSFTGNVDILPTLMRIATGLSLADDKSPIYNLPPIDQGQENQGKQSTIEGRLLPGLGLEGGDAAGERSLYIVEAKRNNAYQPLTKATVALLKEPYKLVYYTGYRDYSGEYELYDLEVDPEESENLYGDRAYLSIGEDLRAEMEARLAAEDARFQR